MDRSTAKNGLMITVIGSACTLAIALFTATTSYWLAQYQRKEELRERSYSRLVGLKVPWSQAIQTHLEAKLLSDYYFARFQVLSHAPNDLSEAKRQNERALNLIPVISGLQREVFEVLADIRISYEATEDLDVALDSLYSFRTFELTPVDRSTIKSEKDLDLWKDALAKAIVSQCEAYFQGKIEGVLPHLLKQLR
jgi:hypothetical protein